MLYLLLQKTEKNAPLLTASKTTPSHPAVVQVYMYVIVSFIHEDMIFTCSIFCLYSI